MLPLSQLSPRASELHGQIIKVLEELEAEVAELDKNGADKADVQVKRGLVEREQSEQHAADREGIWERFVLEVSINFGFSFANIGAH